MELLQITLSIIGDFDHKKVALAQKGPDNQILYFSTLSV